MNAAKTTSERVEKLRQEREALGLRRRELYAHDDDWPKLQELAAKLQRKRERDAKRAKSLIEAALLKAQTKPPARGESPCRLKKPPSRTACD